MPIISPTRNILKLRNFAEWTGQTAVKGQNVALSWSSCFMACPFKPRPYSKGLG